MKKIYIKPSVNCVLVNTETLVAVSLGINNEAQNDIEGDVKGDWGDIWDDDDSSIEE